MPAQPLQSLPEYIEPFQMADKGHSLRGSLSYEGMTRLQEAIVKPCGEVELKLQFGIDQQGFRYLDGNVKSQLELVCQRCLQNFCFEIVSDFQLSPVQDDGEAKALPAIYEPLLATPRMLLRTIVEDELLLNLPIIPLHEASACEVKLAQSEGEAQKPSPFAKLAELKSKLPKH
jgi:uncharacterized protein